MQNQNDPTQQNQPVNTDVQAQNLAASEQLSAPTAPAENLDMNAVAADVSSILENQPVENLDPSYNPAQTANPAEPQPENVDAVPSDAPVQAGVAENPEVQPEAVNLEVSAPALEVAPAENAETFAPTAPVESLENQTENIEISADDQTVQVSSETADENLQAETQDLAETAIENPFAGAIEQETAPAVEPVENTALVAPLPENPVDNEKPAGKMGLIFALGGFVAGVIVTVIVGLMIN